MGSKNSEKIGKIKLKFILIYSEKIMGKSWKAKKFKFIYFPSITLLIFHYKNSLLRIYTCIRGIKGSDGSEADGSDIPLTLLVGVIVVVFGDILIGEIVIQINK